MGATVGDGTGKTGSESLAALIRERRRELRMTRHDLAEATGVPYPTVAQIETAYRGLSPSRVGVFARALGLDPAQLFAALADEVPASTSTARRRRGDDSSTRWHPNPGFAAAMLMAPSTEQPPARASIREVVDEVVGLLSSLPASQRLRALGQVQARTMEGLVDEAVQRRSGRP